MSQVVLNVLCEGRSEETFVKSVLKAYLMEFGVVVKSQMLLTNKKRNFRGGMISFERAKQDILLWIKQHREQTYETHYFTTMFDYYALPTDFPCYADAQKAGDGYAAVDLIEKSFKEDIHHSHFIPYIQLYEFESLVFCGLEQLLNEYPNMERQIEELRAALHSCGDNPEAIDSGQETAPSKRLIAAVAPTYRYDKKATGEYVTKQVGIPQLKMRCRHFKEWIEKLEKLGSEND
jgi:hypothetical protein